MDPSRLKLEFYLSVAFLGKMGFNTFVLVCYGTLQRTEVYLLTDLEAEKSHVKAAVSGKGLLVVSSHGGRWEEKSKGKKETIGG